MKNEKLIIKRFSQLSAQELYDILRIRMAIFIVEQNCAYQDIDELDQESIHMFLKKNHEMAAYLRMFPKDQSQNMVQMGRVLTVERGVGLGEKIMREGINVAKNEMNAEQIYIEAQSYAIGFYEKMGFTVTSDEFFEDGIPHVEMLLKLR